MRARYRHLGGLCLPPPILLRRLVGRSEGVSLLLFLALHNLLQAGEAQTNQKRDRPRHSSVSKQSFLGRTGD
jgi:hypothetical protein